jgi:hypothetical protein
MYTGTLRIQPATLNTGVVDVYNRGLRLRTRPIEDRDYTDENSGDNDGRYQYPQNNRGAYEGDNRKDDDRRDDDVYGNRGNSGNSNGGEGYGSYPRGRDDNGTLNNGSTFSQRDMEDLRSRVTSRITDSDKEKLMKTALDGRSPSTSQVREMLGWLSFDDTKLDFAKWAYSSVADRQNYWKLEDAFSFCATKDDFNKYIRNR